MGRHTVGNKRGSVRGAPPDVYLPFCSLDGDDDDSLRPAIQLFGHFFKGAALFLVIIFALVLWLAFTEPEY